MDAKYSEGLPKEIWQPFKDRIITPDKLVNELNQPLFKEELAGCTSISLSHLEEGVSGEKISVLKWSSGAKDSEEARVNLIPHPDVLKVVVEQGIHEDLVDSVYGSNLDWVMDYWHIGWRWSLMERLYRLGVPKEESDRIGTGFEPSFELINGWIKVDNLKNSDEVLRAIHEIDKPLVQNHLTKTLKALEK